MAATYEVNVAGKKVSYSRLQLTEVLNAIPATLFYIANTNKMRDLTSFNASTIVNYQKQTLFDGNLDKLKYLGRYLKIWARDKIIDLEDLMYTKDQGQDDIRRVEWRETACNTILSDILSGTGYTGNAPATQVSMRMEKFSKLTSVMELAKCVGKDWWRNGTTVYIGDKGASKGAFGFAEVNNDKEFKPIKNKIYLTGRDLEGNFISVICEDTVSQGTYGIKELPLDEKNAADIATLTLIGNRVLAELKDPTLKIKGNSSIVEFLGRNVGDTLTLNEPRKDAVGDFKIKKIVDKEGKIIAHLHTVTPSEDDLMQIIEDFRVSESVRRTLIGEGDPGFGFFSYTDKKFFQTTGESEAGWYILEEAGITVTIEKDRFVIDVGVGSEIASVGRIRTTSRIGKYLQNPRFVTVLKISDVSENIYACVLWGYSRDTHCFGFEINNGDIKAISADGSTKTYSPVLATIGDNEEVLLAASYLSKTGTDYINYYINKVHKYKHTATLPGLDGYPIFIDVLVSAADQVSTLTLDSFISSEER